MKDITTRLAPNSSRRRLLKRIGKDKKVKSVEDICTLMHDFFVAMVDAPSASLPSFVAFKLSRLLAVDTTHLDVSSLSQQIHDLRNEINIVKSSLATDNLSSPVSSLEHVLTNSVKSLSDELQDLKSQLHDLKFQLQASYQKQAQQLSPIDLKNLLTDSVKSLSDNIHDLKSQFSSFASSSKIRLHRSHPGDTSVLLTDTQSDPGSSYSQTVQSDLHLPDHRIATVTVSEQDRHSVTHADDTIRGQTADDGGYTLVQHSNHRITTLSVSEQDRHSVTHAEDTVRPPPRGMATDDGGYTLVQRSKRKRKAIVGSKAVPSDLRSLQPVYAQKSLFVSRLPPEATAEDLSEFVKQAFGLRASCTKIVSGKFHSSFKVSVGTTKPQLLYNSSLWPEGVLVRHYYEHGSQNM